MPVLLSPRKRDTAEGGMAVSDNRGVREDSSEFVKEVIIKQMEKRISTKLKGEI
jgi:hypothetical protein